MTQVVFHPEDLAPGDARSAALDLSEFQVDRIRSTGDPLFEMAYAALWKEFGAGHEMELRETLDQRFQAGSAMLYEMILVRRGQDLVAVRDHSAIMVPGAPGQAVVHLSHNFVSPPARRSGLAGWLRALPIAAARECLAHHKAEAGARVTLVAEMEHDLPDDPRRGIRLRAYEKAGFRKIDPAAVKYHQPDFRHADAIDAAGGPRPLPFQLVIRRVGREHERVIEGGEVRTLVESIHAIYRPQFRPADLAHPLLALDRLPADDATIALLPPAQC